MASFDAVTPTAASSLPQSLEALKIGLPSDGKYTLGQDGALDKETLDALVTFQRAANYLAAAMIFLRENCLMARPLEKSDVKERLLGHWGTCPGLNLVWAHCNRLISQNTDLKMAFVTGPGHGAPAVLATTFLEGSISRFFPQYTFDEPGLSRMLGRFSCPGGFPSHVNAETPGAIHEGGELGYALAVAYGAVMDRPDLIVTCVVGDGEAETGPTAAAWHGHKFIDPTESGAVLPILHANGYKISNRTICGSMDDLELTALFSGYGYQVRIVEFQDDEQIQVSMAASMDWALNEIRRIQKAARSHKGISKPRWPMIVLRTPKGWTGPKELDGKKIEGHWRAHQIPLPACKTDDGQFEMLKSWLGSYHPHELFDAHVKVSPSQSTTTAAGKQEHEAYGKAVIKPEVLKIVPRNDERKMGMLRETFDCHVPLDLPDWREFTLKQGEMGSSMGATSGPFLAKVIEKNPKSFRIFSPDELASNKLDAVFQSSHRQAEFDPETSNNGGRIIEMLSEHTLQGFLQGYTLTGRVGLFPSYESFLGIIFTMCVQYAKFLKLCKEIKWREDIGSITYIESSTLWEQHHNGYSHQNPGFINSLMNLKADVIRIYLPPDANTMVQTLHHCLGSKNYVQLIIGAKQPKMTYLTPDEAERHCIAGASIWNRFSTDDGLDPDVVLVGIGMEVTQEIIAARKLLEKDAPRLRIRVVNVCDLLILAQEGSHPHALDKDAFNSLFTMDKPIVVNFHGYVTVIRDLLFGREHLDRGRISILGYQEEGTTTTPFRMLTVNGCSRFDVAIHALRLHSRAAPQSKAALDSHGLISQYRNQIKLHQKYIEKCKPRARRASEYG